MILRPFNNKLYLIDSQEILDEDEFILINPDFIKVDTLPYSISGVYVYDANNNIISDLESDINELKNQRMQEIQDKFDDLMSEGVFESSLGFTADNRRGNGKDDKDNVSSLIELGQEPVYFRDHDNQFHQLMISDLQTLKQEMIQDGLSKYQWKWGKENEVMMATTIDEINDIII